MNFERVKNELGVGQALPKKTVAKLILSSSMGHLPLLNAMVFHVAGTAGFDQTGISQLQTALEKVFTDVVRPGYDSGEEGQVILEFYLHPMGLEIRVRDQGRPFDPKRLMEEEHDCHPRLMHQLVDEVDFRNLGRNGMETRVIKYLPPGEDPTPQDRADLECTRIHPGNTTIRRMAAEDAEAVSRCAWSAYRYSHPFEPIYKPALLRELNASEDLFSHVAIDEKGSIFGHVALVAGDSDIASGEMALAFVDPRYRGGGTLNRLSESLVDFARTQNMDGVFVNAVTSHIYSQKSAAKMGFNTTCLLLFAVKDLCFQEIREGGAERESLIHAFLPLEKRPQAKLYPPKHHRGMIEKIYQGLGEEHVYEECAVSIPLETLLHARADRYATGHIRVHEYGKNAALDVRHALRDLCQQRVEVIYLYLPLEDPSTAVLVSAFEVIGFFFAGVWPMAGTKDLLVLQFLLTKTPPYSALQLNSELSKELADYVQAHDPTLRS